MDRIRSLPLLAVIAWVESLSVTQATAQSGAQFSAVGPAWQAAWNAKNAEAAAALFAPTAVFAHANGEQVVGQQAIATLFKSVLKVNTPTIGMMPLTQIAAGNGAWVSGSYHETIVFPSRSLVEVHGHYLLVLQRASSSGWRIERMMWSDEH